ncbi:pleckstrin homology domain-containing family G member 4B isoform X5 [Sergentomyia squamirostris]
MAADYVTLFTLQISPQTLSWCSGWPLCVSGALVLHLGALEESIVRPQDLYICVRPSQIEEGGDKTIPQLQAVWHSSKSGITYRCLGLQQAALSPLAIEMLADDLPQLLQSLLVGVERVICRLPLDDLIFPASAAVEEISEISGEEINENSTAPRRLPESTIKRRELITRNTMISNKYTLLRAIKSESGTLDSASPTSSNDSTSAPDPAAMPLFCLSGSFPHIDSDEESCDETKKTNTAIVSHKPEHITPPKSIQDVPEQLLMAGIYLPGTKDKNNTSIIVIDAQLVLQTSVNSYDLATVLLYYNIVPTSPVPFTIHLMVKESSELSTIELLDRSLQLVHGHVAVKHVIVSGTFHMSAADQHRLPKDHLPASHVEIEYCISQSDSSITNYISPRNILRSHGGECDHDQQQWREFFIALEPIQSQCIAVGKKLVTVMGDIRNSDQQGSPSRRQLHSQHRALSRALMDPELQNLRRKGPGILSRLQEQVQRITGFQLSDEGAEIEADSFSYMTMRLREVMIVFQEVDRAALRLEQMTEQRRDRLREMTRQRALEDEIIEVLTWMRNDGNESLHKYTQIPLESGDIIKDQEQDFEKFYFISMKHLAKGRDLHEATMEIENLRESGNLLKQNLRQFSEKLEITRERIEGAARLHHLLGLHLKENDVQQEMQKLAEKIGDPGLIERCRKNSSSRGKIENLSKTSIVHIPTPQPVKTTPAQICNCWMDQMDPDPKTPLPLLAEEEKEDHELTEDVTLEEEDEEEHSKLADSGLGGCDRCEGNDKLTRACSCQSFEDATLACVKSNNSDDLEEDCFETSQKPHTDMSTPFQPNSHLHCHSSNLHLSDLDEDTGLDQKTLKTLLLIMREMIGTERDYVKSLQYIIDNYTQELVREDIPQALRGQRNVIFGNVERIYEFHQQYFLEELERFEKNPLKVGSTFLRHENKFYLYALYNKNKPKSDSLMSEYGTTFFKSKQLELKDKMDLASYLLKPVQRMGKYALLLQQLMKACSNIQGPAVRYIAEDLEELKRAEEMVRFQLRHGNDLLAMDSLRDCDVNVKEQGRLLRQNEFLVWQGRGGKKSLRQVFLFEELVLFSKARRFPDRKNLDLYIYKNSIKTSDIGLTAHVSDSSTKFEIWFRKRKPDDTWTLQSMSEDIKNVWTEEVSKLLWKQARKNREIRLLEMSSMGIGSKPCLDIRPSQNQINDRSISFSQLGKKPNFRNSFTSCQSETKTARRPNSIISVSSMSSGASSSSVTTSAGSSNASTSGAGSSNSSANPSHSSATALQLVEENAPKATCITSGIHSVSSGRKHHRSTTLVSQCSMESGIIADISLTPDESHDFSPNWSTGLKKSQSSSSTSDSQKLNTTPEERPQANTPSPSSSNPYITDSITVHL